MMLGLLWIVGVYGLAAAAVYAVYAFHRKGNAKKPPLLIVCVTHNHAQQVEWYIRMFLFWSVLCGRVTEIKVLDEDSADETVRIVEKAARHRDNISMLSSYEELEKELEGRSADTYRVYVLSGIENHRQIPAIL